MGEYCYPSLTQTKTPQRQELFQLFRGCNEDTVLELTGRILPSPVENVVFVKLQFSARKFSFTGEKKKLHYSDQKIKVMVHGYLPCRLLSILLSAYREKAQLTKPSP